MALRSLMFIKKENTRLEGGSQPTARLPIPKVRSDTSRVGYGGECGREMERLSLSGVHCRALCFGGIGNVTMRRVTPLADPMTGSFYQLERRTHGIDSLILG